MNCPRCSYALELIEHRDVQIDYCPICRGMWLDRGELEKLTEQAMQEKEREAMKPLRPVASPVHHGVMPYSVPFADTDDYRTGRPYYRQSWCMEIYH